MRLDDVTTLVFDVMGTVVDIDGSIAARTTASLGSYGVPADAAERLLADAEARLARGMDDVVAGRAPWRSHRELRAEALAQALAAAGIDGLPADVTGELATVVERLDAWPDSAEALARLRTSKMVVALSNADVAELVGLSAHAGLAWHGVLSAERARQYKPHPSVYLMALEQLAAEPDEVMLVAAHPWDLRAAAEHGFATAYIARPCAVRPTAGDAFDLHADDLGHLARLLEA